MAIVAPNEHRSRASGLRCQKGHFRIPQCQILETAIENCGGRKHFGQVQAGLLAPLQQLIQKRLGEKIQQNGLGVLGRQCRLVTPDRLSGERLELFGPPLQEPPQVPALNRRCLHQLLRQTRMRQDQSHVLAVIAGLAHRLLEDIRKGAEILHHGSALPSLDYRPVAHGQGLDLAIEPTKAEDILIHQVLCF